MALVSCPRCKKLFDKGVALICAKCQPEEDADYGKIRAVLDRSPQLNAEEVAAEAEVPVACVMRMLQEGLITNVSLTEKIKCGRCGAPAISFTKKLCQACLDKLNAEVAVAQGKIHIKEKRQIQIGDFLQARKGEDKRR
jgi:DNA-directed RNA polymerase subunit M/transcription elongation factor TFIIS